MSSSESSSGSKSKLKLKGSDNYHTWIRRLKVKLAGKSLDQISAFVPIEANAGYGELDFDRRTRCEPKPAEPVAEDSEEVRASKKKKLQKWNQKYHKALALILNSIHPNIQGEFDEINDPAALLCTIKNLYAKVELDTEIDLRDQLNSLKFNFHTPADDFFAKIQHIFNRLSEIGTPMNNAAKISTILSIFKGKDFEAFRDSLMPLITAETQYQEIVSRFKTLIRRKQEDMEIDTSYYGQSRGSGRGRRGSNSNRRTSTRGRGGGRYSTSSDRTTNNTGGGTLGNDQSRCFGCNQYGHLAPDCPNTEDTIKRLEARITKLKERVNDAAPTSKPSDSKVQGTKRIAEEDSKTAGGDKAKKARQIC